MRTYCSLVLFFGTVFSKPLLTTRQTEDHIPSKWIYDRVTHDVISFDTIYTNRNLRGLYPLDNSTEDGSNNRETSQAVEVVAVGQGGQIAYIANITFGDQGQFPVVVDTGSSDTWLVASEFQCLGTSLQKVDNSQCRLGKGYRSSSSPTFKKEQNVHFAIQYGDGEKLLGSVGTETVKVGALEVPNQRINVVNNAAWNGDGVTSGLLGLGFPANTANYEGPVLTDVSKPVVYNPFFTSAVKAGLVADGSFAIALQRDAQFPGKGLLTFGGVPAIQTYGQSVAVRFAAPRTTPQNNGEQSEYTVPLDGFKFPDSEKTVASSTQVEGLIDSGTSVLLAPAAMAKAYNSLWDPMTQEAPPFSVLIAGQEFPIQASDLRIRTATGYQSAILPARKIILGDTFMRNVLSVFDVANSQMRFVSTNMKAGAANTIDAPMSRNRIE